MAGKLGLDNHGAAVERDIPQLADVPEHQHVGVEIQPLAGVTAQFGDGETGEGEVGPRSLADVVRFGQVKVDQRADPDPPLGVALDRMLQHADGQQLGSIRANEDVDDLVHGLRPNRAVRLDQPETPETGAPVGSGSNSATRWPGATSSSRGT